MINCEMSLEESRWWVRKIQTQAGDGAGPGNRESSDRPRDVHGSPLGGEKNKENVSLLLSWLRVTLAAGSHVGSR